MNTRKIFAMNLRCLRSKHGWTQGDIAADLDVDRLRYATWERGRSVPNYDLLVAISRLFSVKIDDLLTIDMCKQ